MGIQSKVPTDKYREEYDRIFKKPLDRKDFEYPPIDNDFEPKQDNKYNHQGK